MACTSNEIPHQMYYNGQNFPEDARSPTYLRGLSPLGEIK
jgi:hypothetical protein